MVKEGKSWGALSIASNTSLSSDDEKVEYKERGEEMRVRVVKTLVGEKARERSHSDRVQAPWCKKMAEKYWDKVMERGKFGGAHQVEDG